MAVLLFLFSIEKSDKYSSTSGIGIKGGENYESQWYVKFTALKEGAYACNISTKSGGGRHGFIKE